MLKAYTSLWGLQTLVHTPQRILLPDDQSQFRTKELTHLHTYKHTHTICTKNLSNKYFQASYHQNSGVQINDFLTHFPFFFFCSWVCAKNFHSNFLYVVAFCHFFVCVCVRSLIMGICLFHFRFFYAFLYALYTRKIIIYVTMNLSV